MFSAAFPWALTMPPDVLVMETSAAAAELLVFLSAGGFWKTCAVCLLVVEARRGERKPRGDAAKRHTKWLGAGSCHRYWPEASGSSRFIWPSLATSVKHNELYYGHQTKEIYWVCKYIWYMCILVNVCMYRIYSVVCVDLCKNVKFVTTNHFFPSDFFQLNCCIASASCKWSVK